jgi:hypothetical protein
VTTQIFKKISTHTSQGAKSIMKNSYLICAGIKENMHSIFNTHKDADNFVISNDIRVYKKCGSWTCARRYIQDQIESGFDFLRILTTTVTEK